MERLTFGVAALVAAASLSLSSAALHAQDPAIAIAPAQQAFESGQYDRTLQLVAEARERNESNVLDTFLAAQTQLRRDDNDAARAEFARLGEAGDDGLRLVAQSSTALIDGNLDQALELATQAVNAINARNAAAPPDAAAQLHDFPAFYQLGLVKVRQQEWQPAAEAFERAAQLNPTFAYAYYYAANAWSRIRQIERVGANFDRFLKLAPNAPERAAVQSVMRSMRGN